MDKNLDILLRNNTGNKAKAVLLEGFVVRLSAYKSIFSEIKGGKINHYAKSHLIIGQRGAGKTTLLYRLKYAIEDDTELRRHIIPIMFNEEQYHITELLNLWENVADCLEEIPGFDHISTKVGASFEGSEHDGDNALKLIEEALKGNKKRAILFIENIDVFLKKIGVEEQYRLLEILAKSSTLSLIGSATTYFESISGEGQPFYGFFNIVQLNGLNKLESIKLLVKLGELTNQAEKIQSILNKNPRRIESLRRLTGGNPRTMSYLFQIFLDNGNGKAILDLYKLLDDLTFLYKAELDQLSPQQQKVIDVIARNWDAISVKEIATITKIDSKHVSSVLNALEKNQTIEVVNTRIKNNLYRIKDRFLNIWYLMRFGRKRDRENIVWLVRFYDAWCNKTELSEHVAAYIKNLKTGNYDSLAALDMGNTFLSCINVSPDLKYDLWKISKYYLPKDMIEELKVSREVFYNRIKTLVQQGNFDKAIDALNEIEPKDLHYYTFAYWVYYKMEDYQKAVEFLQLVFEEKQDSITAFTIAETFDRRISNLPKAIEYYKIALEKGEFEAAYRLGQMYFFALRNIEEAIKYHTIAIENGFEVSILALTKIYFEAKRYDEAVSLCETAIEKGDISAMNNLAKIKQAQGNEAEAMDLLKRAVELGDELAITNLAKAYLKTEHNDEVEAKRLFLKAVEVGVPDAYYNLGKFLISNEKDNKEGVKQLKLGIKRKEAESAHYLAHYYQKKNDYVKAEQMFLEAFNLGRRSALLCLADNAFAFQKSDRRKFVIELFQEHYIKKQITGPTILLEYSRMLLWDDQTELALKYLTDAQPMIEDAFGDDDEDFKQHLIGGLTEYFVLLIAKKEYALAKNIFNSEVLNYKQILKPVYYALMNFMKNEFPNEYLKAGSELQETIDEIINEIGKLALREKAK
jgi:TPR repeat protein/DNA-binding transcriptional regulator GbsR (MarR family)